MSPRPGHLAGPSDPLSVRSSARRHPSGTARHLNRKECCPYRLRKTCADDPRSSRHRSIRLGRGGNRQRSGIDAYDSENRGSGRSRINRCGSTWRPSSRQDRPSSCTYLTSTSAVPDTYPVRPGMTRNRESETDSRNHIARIAIASYRRRSWSMGSISVSLMVCKHWAAIISVIRSYPPKLRRQRVFALQRVGTASYPAPATLEQVIVLRRNSRSRQPGRRAPADRRTWHLRSPRRCSGPAD